ncbi:unnamed protein product [Mycetohabitans rhizoxinica HKI 454]|uniref:Transposase n=1 Tax=Mycetohabitans rhizoxinica (strain DSM 19002 / CIP 109453 / HKI 454) TaxID=882378 RepID=E5AQR4_MYCRK|nr:unnamed protein product [Mycetohabitans rhizoxinica HKI 454]
MAADSTNAPQWARKRVAIARIMAVRTRRVAIRHDSTWLRQLPSPAPP